MAGINKVILVGTLGQDPVVRAMPSGDSVASFSVATSEQWIDKISNEKKESTEWHRIVVFGRLADVVRNYLKKGSKVYLEGSIHTRKWQDKESGQDRYSTEIKASSLEMLDSRPDASSVARHTAPAAETKPQGFHDPDDLPPPF